MENEEFLGEPCKCEWCVAIEPNYEKLNKLLDDNVGMVGIGQIRRTLMLLKNHHESCYSECEQYKINIGKLIRPGRN